MYKFIFNNKNSYEDMKSVVVGAINFPMIREKTELIPIAGRKEGSLAIKTGEYDDLKLTLPMKLIDTTRLEGLKVEIQEWLEDIKDNKLYFMDNPMKCYKVKTVEYKEITPKMGYQANYTITFICEPFIKSTMERYKTIAKGARIENFGFIESEPIIKLTLPSSPQTIIININDREFQLKEVSGNIEINTPLLQVTGGKAFKSVGHFPILTKGLNTINWTGNITKFEILPNMNFRG